MGKVNRVEDKIDGRGDDVVIGAESNVSDLIAPPLRNERPSTISNGGAETGGENAAPQKCHTKDLPTGFLGQRCGQCDSLFPHGNFKFCSECGAHLVYAMEGK